MNEWAEECGCFIAYPQQSTSSNQMACWNWFSLKDQVRGAGEPNILAGMTREITAEFDVVRTGSLSPAYRPAEQ
jgi:poly(3-hydroxybutyrate) depolymerase